MFDYIELFPEVKEIQAFFSKKNVGSLSFKWGSSGVVENRRNFFKNLDLDLNNLIMPEQVHGNRIKIVSAQDKGRGAKKNDWIQGFDGLVTNESGIIIGAEAADCAIIFAVDVKNKIIGIVHVGWRGILKKGGPNLIKAMLKVGAKIENIKIATAPHIQDCCFEITQDILPKFSNYDFAVKKNKKITVDLSVIIGFQLEQIGIKKQNINLNQQCTCCKKEYFSWRRDKEKCSGSMIGIITLKK